ncbi:MAG: SUMF1/EgtB/PvdO family nonheme iron enzyme [bacterium]|nr:SUMF1/EgtB/PvdO family nonheme iron enzyme [bacterium]
MHPSDYQRVRELYHEFAHQPLEDTRRALDALKLAAVVRAEIDKLLAHDAQATVFEEGQMGVASLALIQSEVPAQDEPAVPLPDSIAGFRIVEVLGQGGMGVVYRGVQERPQREVAIKVLQFAAASPNILRRFEYEAQILARLDHPYVAKVIAAGIDDTTLGLPYIVMELIPGVDLLAYCEAHELGIIAQLELFGRVCEGVEHAHQNSVVHRDLKPANILVSLDGRPRILDFGIARPTVESDHSTPGRTAAGSVLGSVSWMSPEQARGDVDAVDTRSDVYSLGVVLFRMLSGNMPHDTDGLMPWEALRRICETEPKRLGHEQRELRGDLEAIAARALESDPEKRYAGAGALGRDIQRYLDHVPVEARPWSATYQFAKFTRRHRVLVTACAMLMLAVIGGSGSSLYLWRDAAAGWKLAQGETARARVSEAAAERERAYLLRLSDLRRVRDLVAEANEYWPVAPEHVLGLETLIANAEALLAKVPQHESFREELEASSSPMVSALSRAERLWWLEQLDMLLIELRAMAGEGGTLVNTQRRLASSRTIQQRSISDHADAWDRAIAYAADPMGPYSGLRLTHQLGLVPYDPNPATDLLEFWHIESGDRPERDSETHSFMMMGETGIVLVLIPGGSFLMGSQAKDPSQPNYDPKARPDESPTHRVRLSPFFISRFEMSQAQWTRTMGSNCSQFHSANGDDGHWPRAHPVEKMEWGEAQEAMRRLGLDLPTEAQWEYAARAGTTTPYWSGKEPRSLQRVANVGDEFVVQNGAPSSWTTSPWNDGFFSPAPLGAFPANAFGLHEVHANVREWLRDVFNPHAYQRGEVTDPLVTKSKSPHEERSIRGGDFGTEASSARLAARYASATQGYRISFIGLRPGRELR